MKTYNSAAEAISRGEAANLAEDVAQVAKFFRGQTCLRFRCSRDAIRLDMSDGQCLHVRVDENGKLLAAIDPQEKSGGVSEPSDDYVVVQPNTEVIEGAAGVWRRDVPLQACKDRALRDAYYNGNELYLYWENLNDYCLCFFPARIVDADMMLLYWCLIE